MTLPVPGFTGSPLDRIEVERVDPLAAAALLRDPKALMLDLDGWKPRVDAQGALGWIPLPPAASPDEMLLLGRIDGRPRFARLDPQAPPPTRPPGLFAILDALPPGEAATYAAARSLLDWHGRHRFCANCGQPTGLHRAGWGRACPGCGAEHFPRVDPVVIMLAEHGEGSSARVLVGRQPAFPPRSYSALAGFVEVGESIEEAVARELSEEAGMQTTAVRYLASQPWPFPSQLMIACIATVAEDTIRLDTAELEDAIWVSRDEVAAALTGMSDARFVPPPRYAIAHTLLSRWIDATSSA